MYCYDTDDTRNSSALLDHGVVRFRGEAHPVQCLKHIHKIVYKTAHEERCLPKPCAIGTVYQPAIDPHMQFYALSSVFKYTLQTLKLANGHERGRFCLNQTLEEAKKFCAMVGVIHGSESVRNICYVYRTCRPRSI